MARRDIIVVGASAGGVEALVQLAAGLPADLAAAVFVVLHLPTDARSNLPKILGRAGVLPVEFAADGESIRPGRIYIAPPGSHLELRERRVALTDGPRENSVRPAADRLFRSAARFHGPRVAGVLLSGTDSDGSNGFDSIKLRGGLTIVQDPGEAAFPGMPLSALRRAEVDYTLPIDAIPPLLVKLTGRDSSMEGGLANMRPDDEASVDLSLDEVEPNAENKPEGGASGVTCPDCYGSIWEVVEGHAVSLECRVGHRYTVEAFLLAQGSRVEDALWTAINVLQERAVAYRRFEARFDEGSRLRMEYHQRATDLEEQAALVRQVVVHLVRMDRNGQDDV